MSIAHLLPDFSSSDWGAIDIATGLPSSQPEDSLESFERGYKAGWEDAVKASDQEGHKVGAELARNLQDLSFTYQEAHSAMLSELRPLFRNLISTVLPGFAQKSLAPMVVEQLTEIASDMGDVSAHIRVHPLDEQKLAPMLDQDFGFPIEAVADDDVLEGQILLQFGDREREINLPELLRDISESIDGFYSGYGKDLINE